MAAIGKEIDAGRCASPVTLKAAFDADPDLRTLKGSSYLAELVARCVPWLHTAEDAAFCLRDLSLRRILVGDLNEVQAGKTAAEILQKHRRRERAEARHPPRLPRQIHHPGARSRRRVGPAQMR